MIVYNDNLCIDTMQIKGVSCPEESPFLTIHWDSGPPQDVWFGNNDARRKLYKELLDGMLKDKK